MTYASSDEKEIPNRSVRRQMEVHRALHYVSQQTRTAKDTLFAPSARRRLIHTEKRLCLATLAPRVSALDDRLLLVQEMAYRGHLRAVKRSAARAPADSLGEERLTQRGDSGLPVRTDNWCRRGTTRLRRGQEGARQEASLLVDTEGLVLKAKVHSAKVPNEDGLGLVLKAVR